MARIPITIANYGFNRPPILSEAEFYSYKQIFQVEPNYDFTPKSSFWSEFPEVIWCLIALVVGSALTCISEVFSFIPGIAFVYLLFGMIAGNAQSMWNYQKFLNVKNRYYKNLKSAIISSNNYKEFLQKARNL